MSIINTNKDISFIMPETGGGVNLEAKWRHDYFNMSSKGEVSASSYLKSLPAGSVDLVIPSEIDGIVVNGINIAGGPAGPCLSIRSVSIPSTTKYIQLAGFIGCIWLTTVFFQEGLTEIGMSAFTNCASLTSITIPGSVTVIGSNAFGKCTLLTSININKPINSIAGAPWGAPVANAVKWLG